MKKTLQLMMKFKNKKNKKKLLKMSFKENWMNFKKEKKLQKRLKN